MNDGGLLAHMEDRHPDTLAAHLRLFPPAAIIQRHPPPLLRAIMPALVPLIENLQPGPSMILVMLLSCELRSS